MPVFDRGDVVSVPLDPALGHEQTDTRPALVLTTMANGHHGPLSVGDLRALASEYTMSPLLKG